MNFLRVASAILLLAGATACADTFPSTAPNQEDVVSAPEFILTGGSGSASPLRTRLFPDMCLDVPESIYANGRLLISWSCNLGANQQFLWKSTGEIVPSAKQTMCVDAYTGLGRDGDPIGIWACNGGANQRWTATAAGEIKGIGGKCIGLTSAIRANGTKLTLQTCNASTTQKWDNGGTTPPPPPPPLPPGIAITPSQSIQALVNANPAGTTFILKAGTHLRRTVIPKTGDRFIGEPGAVLDGQGVTTFAFTKGNPPYPSNVTIRSLKITGYAPAVQSGAIDAGGPNTSYGTSGWVIDNNEISYNGEYGIRIGNTTQVTNNNVHHNKRLNIGGVGNNTIVASNEIAFGNYLKAFGINFEAGGTKFVATNGLILRNNYVHENVGAGLWLDNDNINAMIEGNRIDRNGTEGIQIEVSYKTTIRNNTITNNGFADPMNRYGWAWNAGVGVHGSPDVEVYGNTLVSNNMGIVGVQQNRGSGTYGPHIVQNLYVHDNTITQTVGSSGAAQDVGSDAIFTSRNNRWVHNTYHVPSTNRTPFVWKGWTTWALWRSYAQDLTGTLTP